MGADEGATGGDGTAGDGTGTAAGGGDEGAAAGGADTAEGAADGEAASAREDAGHGETYEVFVQWRRGKPHEHAETVNAPDADMALLLAKRNVDVRSGPVSIMVAPREEMRETAPGDTTLVPSTDRDYRNVTGYAGDEGGEP